MISTRSRRRLVATIAALILTAGSPFAWWGLLNALGPSTSYHDPYIEGASQLPDGRYVAYLGDRIYVRYTVVRHKINGDCLLNVYRYGEAVGGPESGRRYLLDYADLQFSGANDMLRPRWPLSGLVLDYAVDKRGNKQVGQPLIPPGQREQELALYVVARYVCNPLDSLFPRYLQGGVKANETQRVRLVVRRERP